MKHTKDHLSITTMEELAKRIDDKTIRSVSFGRSAVTGQRYFVTLSRLGQNSVNIHGHSLPLALLNALNALNGDGPEVQSAEPVVEPQTMPGMPGMVTRMPGL